MNLVLWLRLARRDLRSGLGGFWIFLSCLALGTAAIAIIGSLSAAVQRGLQEQGQPLLGGDVEFALIHRQATAEEWAFMTKSGMASRVATLRGMAKADGRTALVEIKSPDASYPLYGKVELNGAAGLGQALARQEDAFGAAVDPLLLGRLGLKIGDRLSIGTADFRIVATVAKEPDRLSDGIVLGPRVFMSEEALAASGLVQPGSLVNWRYRLRLASAATSPDGIVQAAKQQFPDAGWRIKTRDNAALGAERFIDRLGMFLTLVGLSALVVGGAGISNAVTAFVSRRTETIAIYKCLGATATDTLGIFLAEIAMLSLLAIVAGLGLGALAPPMVGALFAGILPLPIATGIEWVPLGVAALLGFLIAMAFALWPLATLRHVRAAALFRHHAAGPWGWPGLHTIAAILVILAAATAVVFAIFDDWRVIGWFMAGLAASFALLFGLAWLIVAGAARLARPRNVILRHALTSIHRPGSHPVSVILALGLGLTLFVTLAITDRSMSRELSGSIPDRAPAFFFLDVRSSDLPGFTAALQREAGVTRVTSAPMLRGRIVKVKGVEAAKAEADPEARWALQGDRGLTYADALPAGSTLVEGTWWAKDYGGPPLVSMVDEIALGLGLKIGDEVVVNVLGRELTAKIANLRQVNWRSLGINFVMVFSPNALAAAPHSYIVTVEMNGGDEAVLLNRMASAFPSVTAIRVKDAIQLVSDLLGKMLNGVRGASLVTLVIGILVLSGALAAGLSGRSYEAVVLKTYGATRRQLIAAFSAEYAVLGLSAAVFAILVGSVSSWFLARFILEIPWSFSLPTAILTAFAAMALTVMAGLLSTWSALSVKPAGVLRNE